MKKEVKTINEPTKEEEAVKVEEVTENVVKNIEEEVKNISGPIKKIEVSDKIENENIINEIMEELKSG